MKIIIFDGTFKTTTFINRLCKGLVNNHDVYILGFNEELNSKIEGVHYIGLGSNSSKLNYLKRSLQLRKFNILKILKLIIDLVIGNKKEIHQENIQLVVDRIKPDVIHFQWISVIDWLGELQLPLNTKTILSQRGFHINIRPFINKNNLEKLEEFFSKINGFHSVSEAIKRKSNLIYTSKSKKDHVVYSGFEFQNIPIKANNKLSSNFKILSVGRNHWIKDYKTAILAINTLVKKGIDCVYTIIGIDKDEELLYLVHDLGLEKNIKFINKVNQTEVYEYMIQSDLLLLPSIEEGIANVCIEAMFCRLPVISTNCGGMKELIVDGETGFIVPTRNSIAMADKIAYFSQLSELQINEMTSLAREKVIYQHNVDKMVRDMELLYLDVYEKN